MQKKINMYKSLFNKEIQTLSIGRFPLMTLSKLSRIGSKTKPKQSQTKPIFKMPKMDVKSIETDDYGINPAFAKNRNKAKTKPIFNRRPSAEYFAGDI